MTLCQRLTELGVYHSDGPGRPSLYHSYEEALIAKRHMARKAQNERRARIRDARLRGEDLPIFARGRKPLYATKLEAIEAKRQQDKLASQRYKERVEKALEVVMLRLRASLENDRADNHSLNLGDDYPLGRVGPGRD